MFLDELQPEEGMAFLELAALISKVDGNLSIYESSVLHKYKKELGLEDYRIKGLDIEDILKTFKNVRSQKIILAEIFKLIFSDGIFHNQERESVRFIKKYFGFDESEFGDFKSWINSIKELSIK